VEFLVFISIVFGALFIVAAVFQVAVEIRKTRILLEHQFRLKPVEYINKEYAYAPMTEKFEDA
tara:strand:- start:2319 stop:2507 length:189 start_codon:yes stop_codon:yes gene_type:complete